MEKKKGMGEGNEMVDWKRGKDEGEGEMVEMRIRGEGAQICHAIFIFFLGVCASLFTSFWPLSTNRTENIRRLAVSGGNEKKGMRARARARVRETEAEAIGDWEVRFVEARERERGRGERRRREGMQDPRI
jgi:hypothetical protein